MSGSYLRFWGVRGSYAAPHKTHLGVGGNTSCVEVRSGDSLLVLDGGTGIIPLGEALMQAGDLSEMMVVFTHYHWDHICGLPFFQPAFSPKWTIKFFGPGESAADIEQKLSNQMKAPYFPVETETWMAHIEYVNPNRGGLQHGPIGVAYHSVHHPGMTYGYRLNVAGKSVVYISDNEIDFLKSAIARRYEEFDAEEHQLLKKIETEERTAELAAIRGTDILIHDAQYTPHDYDRKRGWGHSCYVDTVNFAIEAGVKALYLYHHDPTYDDGKVGSIHDDCLRIIAERGSTMACHIAYEGLVVDL
ncbi:MAG: MBL fold metallo-hydrolase [Gammaproteobacteria bacterium]|nr:MBL fold metallo-hydrolase [Gammaproteobacteria bacterium]MBI5617477.1 MBL fold metallo-hydrolase [Gammaproteobacteria bacterium]